MKAIYLFIREGNYIESTSHGVETVIRIIWNRCLLLLVMKKLSKKWDFDISLCGPVRNSDQSW